MATLSNESVCRASLNKFSLLQELSGTDADQSLEVLESIDRDVSADEAADAEPNENLTRAETSKSDHPLAGAPNDNFRKNICSEDDLRSRIFGTFVAKFLACLPLQGISNI